MALGLLILLVFLLVIAALALQKHYSYWRRMGIREIKPKWIVGNLMGLLNMHKSPAEFISQLYNHPEAENEPFVGIHVFHKPAILLRDPEMVKHILIKDFSGFSNRYSNSDHKADPLGSQNIFFLKNPAWKEVRYKLSPFFTGNRLKQMFPLIEEVGASLDAHLRQQPLHNERMRCFDLEAKELCALFTTDVIATVAYGIKANSFTDPNSEFRRHGRSVFEFSLLRAAEFTMVFFLPHLVPFFGFKVVPKEATHFLRNTINYVMSEREQSGQKRNDLIDILIEFRRSTQQAKASGIKDQFVFEGDILVAQAVLFFTAGFESSSSSMAFAMYELAKDADVQQRLREEIKDALVDSGGQVTLTMIESLEFMQMVLLEVLRMYPPLPFLDRECTSEKDYTLAPFHNFVVPKGMPVYIPCYALHMDPLYFPQPRKFLPERFSPENRKLHTPYTYMPFGLGPHGCIGERFGLLQAKVGLVYLLRNHMITTSERTPHRMQLDPKAIITQAKGGIPLRLVRDPLGV
ncbi:probable cytochrome P450 6g2 [Drosophila eugracilis]|uniref:probable cytochrome P450 6g2 n=1 Tax=Drosophila eugracilis TaxID=29029 RepID=UPI0007E7AC63|nr:probable cytochrome P450 6g2 [Drosophila eugracilis]